MGLFCQLSVVSGGQHANLSAWHARLFDYITPASLPSVTPLMHEWHDKVLVCHNYHFSLSAMPLVSVRTLYVVSDRKLRE